MHRAYTLSFTVTLIFVGGTPASLADSNFLNAYKIRGCGAGPGYATSIDEMRLQTLSKGLSRDIKAKLTTRAMIGAPDVESVKRYLLRRFDGRFATCNLILMPDGTIADLKVATSSLVPTVDPDALSIVRSGEPFDRSRKGKIEAYSITFPYVDISSIPIPPSFVEPDADKAQNPPIP